MKLPDILIVVGTLVLLLGLGLRLVPGLFSWFGTLPGDIRIEGERSSIFIPITSMIIVSVALSLIISIVSRFFRP